MKNREYAVEAVVQEFYGQSMTEDEGFIAPDFFGMARALVEARAERELLQRMVTVAVKGIDGLRTQLAAHGDWCHECNAPQWVIGDGSHECTTVAELHAQLAAARVVDDAMVERAWGSLVAQCGHEWWDDREYTEVINSPDKDDIRTALTAALSEAPCDHETAVCDECIGPATATEATP